MVGHIYVLDSGGGGIYLTVEEEVCKIWWDMYYVLDNGGGGVCFRGKGCSF